MDKLYKVLGLEKDASASDIKKAYKKLVMVHHPDRGGDEEKFKEIAEAYEVLSDPKKKQHYDTYGTMDQNNGGGYAGYSDAFDFMEQMFGRARNRQPTGSDINIQYNLNLSEFFNGVETDIKIDRMILCSTCDGNRGDVEICRACNGSKYVRVKMGNVEGISACGACGGVGTTLKNPCNSCQGEGYRMVNETIHVVIPKCSYNNIVHEGMGNEAKGLQNGNLNISVKVINTEGFEVNGFNLIITEDINYYDLLLGCSKEVKTIEGTKIKITIPKNTDYKKLLKVSGKGLYAPNSEQRGDMMISLNVVFPTNISDVEVELLESIKKIRE